MPKNPDVPCIRCGTLTVSTRSSAPPDRRICHPCRRKPEHVAAMRAKRAVKNYQPPTPCAQCGVVFTPSHIRVRTCSLTCGQKLRWAEGRIPDSLIKYATNDERAAGTRDMWQRKNRRRRTLKRGGVSERYTLVEIAERDGHRCRLCDRKVPMAQKHPRPLSPTIDHIVPISLGGDDTRVNVQLAHRICNIRKSNRGAGDQLALVG